MSQITLKPDTELKSVETRSGYKVNFVTEDYEAPLWVYSCESYGEATMVISARSWDSAYEACIDEMRTIDDKEVFEAYGFDSQSDMDACENWDDINLIEGYRYQSNFTGTGIVGVGHMESLDPLTPDYLKQSGIQLTIGEIE